MRIALVSCCFERGNLSFPLGALCIQSAISTEAKLAGCELKHFSYICDADDPVKAANQVKDFSPDVVGLSVYLWNRSWFDKFTDKLKGLDIKLFSGGPEVTANCSSFDLDVFDFICVGEGEQSVVSALIDLSEKKQPHGPGIVSKSHREFSYSCPADLDSLDSVLLSPVARPFLKQSSTVLWEMTRGCPFGCHFCFESKGLRSVRHFGFERLEKELEVLISNKVKDVFVLDPTFNIDRERTQRILELLIDKAPDWMHFSFEVRAELLDQKLIDLFSKIFCSLQIGLQSIEPKVLKAINRSFDKEVFLKKIEMLNRSGVVYGLDLIIGLPYDSFQGFRRSLDFAISCRPSNIDIFRLAVLPGTVLYENAASFDLDYQKEAPYLINGSPTFSNKDLRLSERLKNACDLLYTKGEACMWMHCLCEAANMTETEVLVAFWEFCPDCADMDYDGDQLYSLQDEFVKSLLSGSREVLEAVLSYMEFHQGLSFLYDTGDQPVVSLSYDPNQLSGLDDENVHDFIRRHRKLSQRQNYLLYQDDDGNLMFEQVK